MNNRMWLGLLLVTVSMIVPMRTATAQGGIRGPAKQSHHDLPGGIDMANAEEMMAQRLQELHELHQLQDQVQGLLQDPAFRRHLANIPPEDLQKLQEKLLKGKGLSQDSNWNQLLQHATSQHKFNERQIDILRSWAERNEQKAPAPSANGLLENHGSDAAPPVAEAAGSTIRLPPQQAPVAPEPSLFDRMQEETTKWMVENLDDVGGDILEALTEMKMNDENSPLAEVLRSLQQPDFSGLNVSEQAIGLSRYLSNAGDFLHEQRGAWDEMRSLLRKAPVPSLPNLGGPSVSAPAAAAADGNSWAPTFLSLLMLGAIVLLLSLRGIGSKAQPGSGAGEEWRLGSWPVSPDRVSTRQDLIRSFEYLALLCLGPAAGACHHRALAERLAEQDGGNPARRHAAELLSWLYEQARYAPAGEALSQEQFSDARRALWLLAGVTAS
jgi:hypothetical protein